MVSVNRGTSAITVRRRKACKQSKNASTAAPAHDTVNRDVGESPEPPPRLGDWRRPRTTDRRQDTMGVRRCVFLAVVTHD